MLRGRRSLRVNDGKKGSVVVARFRSFCQPVRLLLQESHQFDTSVRSAQDVPTSYAIASMKIGDEVMGTENIDTGWLEWALFLKNADLSSGDPNVSICSMRELECFKLCNMTT